MLKVYTNAPAQHADDNQVSEDHNNSDKDHSGSDDGGLKGIFDYVWTLHDVDWLTPVISLRAIVDKKPQEASSYSVWLDIWLDCNSSLDISIVSFEVILR